MKLSTELKNLPVVSIAEGVEIGVVKDFIIDPLAKAIVAMVIEDPSWYEGAKAISFSLVHSIGDFAITTENVSSVVALSSMPELTDLLRKELKIIGSKIITRGGRLIGFVKEYSIEATTGDILGLELTSDSEVGGPDKNVIPCESIITLGRDVIIVSDDVESNLGSNHREFAKVEHSAPRPRPATSAPAPAARPAAPAPAVLDDIEPDFTGGMEEEAEVDIEALLDIDTAAETSGSVEEPVFSEDDISFDEPAESDEAKESLSEIFERRQIKYMLGKKVARDIDTDDGMGIAVKGDIISEDIIQRAKETGKFLELSMNIEIEE